MQEKCCVLHVAGEVGIWSHHYWFHTLLLMKKAKPLSSPRPPVWLPKLQASVHFNKIPLLNNLIFPSIINMFVLKMFLLRSLLSWIIYLLSVFPILYKFPGPPISMVHCSLSVNLPQ